MIFRFPVFLRWLRFSLPSTHKTLPSEFCDVGRPGPDRSKSGFRKFECRDTTRLSLFLRLPYNIMQIGYRVRKERSAWQRIQFREILTTFLLTSLAHHSCALQTALPIQNQRLTSNLKYHSDRFRLQPALHSIPPRCVALRGGVGALHPALAAFHPPLWLLPALSEFFSGCSVAVDPSLLFLSSSSSLATRPRSRNVLVTSLLTLDVTRSHTPSHDIRHLLPPQLQVAIAEALAVVSVGAAVGCASHLAAGSVRLRVAVPFALCAMVARTLPQAQLTIAIARP